VVRDICEAISGYLSLSPWKASGLGSVEVLLDGEVGQSNNPEPWTECRPPGRRINDDQANTYGKNNFDVKKAVGIEGLGINKERVRTTEACVKKSYLGIWFNCECFLELKDG
jgi:hypothetical protein